MSSHYLEYGVCSRGKQNGLQKDCCQQLYHMVGSHWHVSLPTTLPNFTKLENIIDSSSPPSGHRNIWEQPCAYYHQPTTQASMTYLENGDNDTSSDCSKGSSELTHAEYSKLRLAHRRFSRNTSSFPCLQNRNHFPLLLRAAQIPCLQKVPRFFQSLSIKTCQLARTSLHPSSCPPIQ